MNYPTMQQVEEADIVQICRWTRFLKSPGMSAINHNGPLVTEDFNKCLQEETPIMKRIVERQEELGGWTPNISKIIGWGS